ncbi:MAG TPA: hypothetical protein VFR64_08750 [Methylomirabilota bacterium]|jgi:hypothetical protein|nr:hypothetical protein [Methylomirabilota bacterium]
MSVIRRVIRPVVTPVPKAPAPSLPPDEITYRGYRIQPESYSINRTAWSPRVVVSMRIDGHWAQAMPLYSPRVVRFSSREEADRCALEVAKAWIDTTVQSR